MASRSHTWFDAEKLLPGEDLVRSSAARVRTDTPPYWWEGELVLTSDRLFFLPRVHNPFLPHIAFWLRDLVDVGPAGRNRLHVRSTRDAALFQPLEGGPRAMTGRVANIWLKLIARQSRVARPASAFVDDRKPRRAAG